MGDIGSRAVAHFKSLHHRDPLEVTEWGESAEEPLLVFGKPVSVSDARRIYATGIKSNFDMYIEAMLLLAHDAQGKPLFDLTDKPLLRRSSHEVIERVGGYLLKARDESELNPDFETVVKNSKASQKD